MRIALFQPDIPQNTGTILRLAACLSAPVDIIHPCGFAFGDKQFKRAVMDYLQHVDIKEHASFEDFHAYHQNNDRPIFLATTHGSTSVYETDFPSNAVLLFGRESAGVPDYIHKSVDHRILIPMHRACRSLNLAISVSMIAGECYRQQQIKK